MKFVPLINCQYVSSGLGVGVAKPISSVPLFPNFSASPKYMLAIEYHIHIWQLSPQLSCQIWMRCKGSNRYFCRINNLAYGEINDRSCSTPPPPPPPPPPDITVAPHDRHCVLKLPAIRLVLQQIVPDHKKKQTTRLRITGSFANGIHRWLVYSLKGQGCGKLFHVIPPSCANCF